MEIQKKGIRGCAREVLVLSAWEPEEAEEVRRQFADFPCVEISLSDLHYLTLFQNLDTLILTGGIPSTEGFCVLHGIKSLENLILDYEETDSDEEGIDLSAFPNLKYVLSRSNLNILHGHPEDYEGVAIEILNYYRDGKKVNCQYPSTFNLYQIDKFLFFSAEAQTPAGSLLMDILRPVEKRFLDVYSDVRFSANLDTIGIIPICMEESRLQDSSVRERKLVSLKRRYADIRLTIPYGAFVFGDMAERIKLCKENIQNGALYIHKKDPSFRMQAFLSAVEQVFSEEFS